MVYVWRGGCRARQGDIPVEGAVWFLIPESVCETVRVIPGWHIIGDGVTLTSGFHRKGYLTTWAQYGIGRFGKEWAVWSCPGLEPNLPCRRFCPAWNGLLNKSVAVTFVIVDVLCQWIRQRSDALVLLGRGYLLHDEYAALHRPLREYAGGNVPVLSWPEHLVKKNKKNELGWRGIGGGGVLLFVTAGTSYLFRKGNADAPSKWSELQIKHPEKHMRDRSEKLRLSPFRLSGRYLYSFMFAKSKRKKSLLMLQDGTPNTPSSQDIALTIKSSHSIGSVSSLPMGPIGWVRFFVNSELYT